MLKFCSMGVHLRSRDLLEFRKISANISETVQDRHICVRRNWRGRVDIHGVKYRHRVYGHNTIAILWV